MSVREWFGRRSRNSRRKKAARENRNEPLREFVYLDEVSVFSLLASRIGALATDFSDTESSSLTSEVKGGGGISVPGAKAQVSSRVSAGDTRGTQVMRKSTVQSTFRELYGYVRDSLVVHPGLDEGEMPSFQRTSDLVREARHDSEWVIAADRLTRGQLFEVEVSLYADASFRTSVIFSTVLDFLEELPPTMNREVLANVIMGTRILDKLLVGLVPVRGTAVHYSSVTVDDQELIVHKAVVAQLAGLQELARPVHVVGVAEEDLFWRDIRRVLFSGSRYRMLCRLGRDGVHPNWTPVKLIDVLEGVAPDLRTLVDGLPSLLEQVGDQQEPDTTPDDLMRGALRQYARDVLALHGHDPLDDEGLVARGLPTDAQCSSHSTLQLRRDAFHELTDTLADEFGFEADPHALAACRSNALLEAGFLATDLTELVDETTESPDQSSDRYLDCEIVAVYW